MKPNWVTGKSISKFSSSKTRLQKPVLDVLWKIAFKTSQHDEICLKLCWSNNSARILSPRLVKFLAGAFLDARKTHTRTLLKQDYVASLNFKVLWNNLLVSNSVKESLFLLQPQVATKLVQGKYLRHYWSCCQPSQRSFCSLQVLVC